ncbi:MAG: DedA family protein [Xanthobacteraceae bacterium]|nr:DedA family protein [Xanthobacteraceae bacterium]
MEHAIHELVHAVAAHPQWAYAVLFLAAWLEAVPVVGSFVPGSTIILSLSALIGAGDLSLAGVLAATICGAALGDGAAYMLGRSHPDWPHRLWPLSRYPDVIRKSEEFFRQRGYVAVFLARFLPPVRAFVPVTAGALGMPPGRFFPVNLAAIACWAPAHIVPGMLAGTAWHRAGALGGHVALPLIVGLIALAALVWGFRRWQRRGAVEAGS